MGKYEDRSFETRIQNQNTETSTLLEPHGSYCTGPHCSPRKADFSTREALSPLDAPICTGSLSASMGSPGQPFPPGMAIWNDRTVQVESCSSKICSPLSNRLLHHPRSDLDYSSSDSCDALEQALEPKNDLVRGAGQTVLLHVHLASTLLSYLGIGWKWMVALGQLIAFASLLMPGFLQMVLFYFFSSRIRRGIRYGPNPRNVLDVYIPRLHWLTMDGPRPVVIYVTGGAWTIGYKAWGALVGRRLSQRGVLAFCLDYRNFPQGTGPDMLEDINAGISWVLQICQYFGGDPNQVHLVGQSAGAQLVSLAVFMQAKRLSPLLSGGLHCEKRNTDYEPGRNLEPEEELIGAHPIWDPRQVKSFVGVSGAYDLQELHMHLHRRGMYMSLLREIFTVGSKVAYQQLSPTHVARSLGPNEWSIIPPIHLLHGTHDRTVPPSIALDFEREVVNAGGRAELNMWPGKTHTSPIVEDPLKGHDDMLGAILSVVHGRKTEVRASPMVPGFLADFASFISPF